MTDIETLKTIREHLKLAEKTSFSAIVKLVTQLSKKDENLTSADISRIVGVEPQVSAKILATVNRLQYNAQSVAITNLPHAILFVGFKKIRNLVYTFLMAQHLQNRKLSEEQTKLFSLSILGSLFAKSAMYSSGSQDPDDAFMLSAIRLYGRQMLATYLPEEYEYASKIAEKYPERLAFKYVFGLSSYDLSRELLSDSRIPTALLRSLREFDILEFSNRSHLSQDDEMMLYADFGNRLGQLVSDEQHSSEVFRYRLIQLIRSYRGHIKVSETDANLMLLEGLEEFKDIIRDSGFEEFPETVVARLHHLSAICEETILQKPEQLNLRDEDWLVIREKGYDLSQKMPSEESEVSDEEFEEKSKEEIQIEKEQLILAEIDQYYKDLVVELEAEKQSVQHKTQRSELDVFQLKKQGNIQVEGRSMSLLSDENSAPTDTSILERLQITEEFFSIELQKSKANRSKLLLALLEGIYEAFRLDDLAYFEKANENKFNLIYGYGKFDFQVKTRDITVPQGKDIFHVCLLKSEDILIQEGYTYHKLCPSFLLDRINPNSFCLLPIRNGENTKGIIWASKDRGAPIHLSLNIRKKLQALRLQLVSSV